MSPRSPLVTVPVVLLAAAMALGGCASQRRFATPDDAVTALAAAVADRDRQELRAIFGPRATELRSPDEEQDRLDAASFSRAIGSGHEVEPDAEDADVATLLVGPERWPFAVPLVREAQGWRFDTDAGIEELTNRRIGRNELRTIAALGTLIDAQAAYYAADPDRTGRSVYASRLLSSPGRRDGLYWDAPGGVDPSPIGPVMAAAATRRTEEGEPVPYNGYVFRLLRRQGPSAPGGEMTFEADGLLVHGWAVIARPAEYGETGVMSFLASHGGVVYQADLGHDTTSVADSISAFDPAPPWAPVQP